MSEYTFEEIIEMWNNDPEIKELRVKFAKEEYKWALERHKILIESKKIYLEDLKNESLSGKNTEYATKGLVFFYNSQDVLLCWQIIFYNSSVFKVVCEQMEINDLSDGWHEELNYAKFLPEPYADPMDLIILSNAFNLIYKPKYRERCSSR